MKSLSNHLTTVRNWIIAIVLLNLAACDKNDNNLPADELNTADQPSDVIVAPNILVRLSDLPAPDTNASTVNYPGVGATTTQFPIPGASGVCYQPVY
jgi:hypothetical protein